MLMKWKIYRMCTKILSLTGAGDDNQQQFAIGFLLYSHAILLRGCCFFFSLAIQFNGIGLAVLVSSTICRSAVLMKLIFEHSALPQIAFNQQIQWQCVSVFRIISQYDIHQTNTLQNQRGMVYFGHFRSPQIYVTLFPSHQFIAVEMMCIAFKMHQIAI